MQLTVTGKNINVGDSLRRHVEQGLKGVAEKYFTNPIESTVIISKEALYFRADVSLHIGKGIIVRCHASDSDAYLAVDTALAHLGTRLRRHKHRLRDHHKVDSAHIEDALTVHQFVLSSQEEAAEEKQGNPVVIAETATKILSLSVSEAIMHLDLSEQTVLLFKNRSNDVLNVVFRRPDGNIGWIDPSLIK